MWAPGRSTTRACRAVLRLFVRLGRSWSVAVAEQAGGIPGRGSGLEWQEFPSVADAGV